MRHLAFVWILFLASLSHAQSISDRTYRDIVNALNQLERDYPRTVKVFTLGYSNEGIAIQGVHIGQGSLHNLAVATHHGNELAATEVGLAFAKSIAENPIPGQRISVIPVLNINGYAAHYRYEMINGEKVNQNRDYPGPCGSSGPFLSTSTKALADFLARENIVAAATLHTYKPAVVYPWGISTNDVDTLSTPIFIDLAKAATVESHYQIGYSTTVMFPADGTFEDYAYWKHGIYALLFEIGEVNVPPPDVLSKTIRDNVAGLRAMFSISPTTRAAQHEFTGQCYYGDFWQPSKVD
jgi:carboxypeptidase T